MLLRIGITPGVRELSVGQDYVDLGFRRLQGQGAVCTNFWTAA